MTRSMTVRLLRIGLALTLLISAASASLAAPAPFQAANADPTPPGFDALPQGASLITLASGQVDSLGGGPVTLFVERLVLEPGDWLGEIAGPQVIQVEQGALTYEDDLGLEAEVVAGSAQFFAEGEGDTLANFGEVPAILVRTSLIPIESNAGEPVVVPEEDPAPDDSAEEEAPGAGDESNETGGRGDESDDDNPGEESETRDRDHLPSPELAGVNALILQDEGDTPDEVVITLTETGFDPAELTLAGGGSLVIENATGVACHFEVPGLAIAEEIDPGGIDAVTIEGPAGDYLFVCLDDDDAVTGEGNLTLVAAEGEPVATPDAENEPVSDDIAPDGDTPDLPSVSDDLTGVLLETALMLATSEGVELFSAWIVLDPGVTIALTGADGSLGIVTAGGDLTVSRPGRTPSRLRDGRSVVLPSGTAAELTNSGDLPITLYLAGITGSEIAPQTPDDQPDIEEPGQDDELVDEPIDEPIDESPADDGDGIPTAAFGFFPSDAEMAVRGLVPTRDAYVETTDPGSNDFWFDDPEEASDLLPEFGWLGTVYLFYGSQDEETEYGVVTLLLLNVDVFGDDGGAADYFAHIDQNEFGPSGRSSRQVSNLNGVDDVVYGTFSDPDSGDEFAIMVVRTGSYVLTLYAFGPELDAVGILTDVVSLIFGPRG